MILPKTKKCTWTILKHAGPMEALERRITMLVDVAIWVHVTRDDIWWLMPVGIISAIIWASFTLSNAGKRLLKV